MSARHIFKAASAEQRRLEDLLAKQEKAVQRAFAQFVRDVKSDAVMRRVRVLLEAGRIDDALHIVDQYVIRMAAVIPQVFQTAAVAEVAALSAQIGTAGIGISFDPGNPRAAAAMRQSRLQFIREFSDGQREAVRNALTEALSEGVGPRQSARVFRDAIGLTGRQEAAVRNFERLLREGDREALTRDLRDRRFDRTLQRAFATKEPLSEAQIERMTARYRERFLIYRSENIARTEGGRVLAEGRDEALRQTMEQADISDDLIERTWRATRDQRTRDTHRRMQGQKVIGSETPFVSPSGARLRRPHDPNAPASEVANCRCQVTVRIRQVDEV